MVRETTTEIHGDSTIAFALFIKEGHQVILPNGVFFADPSMGSFRCFLGGLVGGSCRRLGQHDVADVDEQPGSLADNVHRIALAQA